MLKTCDIVCQRKEIQYKYIFIYYGFNYLCETQLFYTTNTYKNSNYLYIKYIYTYL